MKIYCGNPGSPSEHEFMKKNGLGIMLTAPQLRFKKFHYAALDNGAYAAWKNKIPWKAGQFLACVERARDRNLNLDFIVLPDIVGGGLESLSLSYNWTPILLPYKYPLYLAVQEGMSENDVMVMFSLHLAHNDKNRKPWIDGIFVGGPPKWKKKTAKSWVRFAHDFGLKAHIGAVGTFKKLLWARKIGADSVDSTNFVRNKTWHIINSSKLQSILKQ